MIEILNTTTRRKPKKSMDTSDKRRTLLRDINISKWKILNYDEILINNNNYNIDSKKKKKKIRRKSNNNK